MELLLAVLLPIAAGAALGRWTRWHPLLIGAAIAIVPGALGLLLSAAFSTDGAAILVTGGIWFLVGGLVSSFGAFLGWLRRKHIERNI